MVSKRIAVLTSGGDCPGLNAVIRGVVHAAAHHDWEVIGFTDGYEGMLSPVRYRILDTGATDGIMQLGGTILGTTNKGRFVAKIGHGNKAELDPAIISEARETIEGLGIEAVVCIGGDGSLSTAQQLFENGIKTIGVPKTIDNDIQATSMTFGFDSAISCVVDSMDKLYTTARSHKRCMVVEVMGRYAGWIALHGGLAGGADIILLPEIPFDIDKVCDVVQKRDANGYFTTMIVVAEGAKKSDGSYATKDAQGRKGEAALGGIGDYVAGTIAEKTGKETRCTVLGHLQRGGAPTALDRILGSSFGVAAVELIAKGKFGHMVSYRNDEITDVPIIEAVSHLRNVKPDSQLVKTCRNIGISFGD
ncbi:MAG: 6-phosphofructokinase [Verrucomicrobiales bacterium]|jgi:6-phosphofructokinase 1|nr:6-phosphofructokinase [Verrucomicrobiales bacterium]MDR1303829.1 6-phosphofructokinase [Verrucomicrobiales bacterium]